MSEHCEKIVHQLIDVEAKVKLKPRIKHGKPKVTCIKSKVKSCSSTKKKKKGKSCCSSGACKFKVTQVICVEIPLKFGVKVDVEKGIIHCGKPEVGPCSVGLATPDRPRIEVDESAKSSKHLKSP